MRARRSILVLTLLIAACAGGGDRPASPTASAPAAEAIPHPDLDAVEPAVREQIQEWRATLEDRLTHSAAGRDDALSAAYGELGMVYHAYDLHLAARACYRNALRLAPDDPRWNHLLGHVYEGLGEYEAARDVLERALASDPRNLATAHRLAGVELALNRLDAAQARYRRLADRDAADAAARFGLGRIALAREDPATAVEHLEAALRLAPEADAIRYPLGLAHRALGDAERALPLLETRGDRLPAVPDAYLATVLSLAGGMRVHQFYGTMFFQGGDYERALVAFRKAVEAAPDEALVRTNLGLTLLRLGDRGAALAELERAVELDPQDPFARYNLGTLLADMDRNADAVAHFEAALAVDPDRIDARLNLANALSRLERLPESLTQYRLVLEREPQHADAQVALARTLGRLDRWDEARSGLERAHGGNPGNRAIRSALARLLAAAPDEEVRDAGRAFRIATPLAAGQASIDEALTLAMVAAANGRFNDAVGLQRRALESARAAGRTDLLPALERQLERYRSGQPCREPWS